MFDKRPISQSHVTPFTAPRLHLPAYCDHCKCTCKRCRKPSSSRVAAALQLAPQLPSANGTYQPRHNPPWRHLTPNRHPPSFRVRYSIQGHGPETRQSTSTARGSHPTLECRIALHEGISTCLYPRVLEALTHLRHKHGSYHRATELVVDVRIGALLDD